MCLKIVLALSSFAFVSCDWFEPVHMNAKGHQERALRLKQILNSPETISFSDIQEQVLVPHCVRCHGDQRLEKGVRLTDYTSLFGKTPVVLPGQPQQSRLYSFLKKSPKKRMPKSYPLPPDLIKVVKMWIENGALVDPKILVKPEIEKPQLATVDHYLSHPNEIDFNVINSLVLKPYCLGCHNTNDEDVVENDGPFENFEDWTQLNLISGMPPVVRGHLKKSEMFLQITGDKPDMPPINEPTDEPLPNELRTLVGLWIVNCAPKSIVELSAPQSNSSLFLEYVDQRRGKVSRSACDNNFIP